MGGFGAGFDWVHRFRMSVLVELKEMNGSKDAPASGFFIFIRVHLVHLRFGSPLVGGS